MTNQPSTDSLDAGSPPAPVRWTWFGSTLRRNAIPALLTGAACLLLALLGRTDRDKELYEGVSHRYRFHAIPVAISQVYHHREHDYTSSTKLAHRFQDTKLDLDSLIWEMIWFPPKDDTETYYWTADDRGLSDYVALAFRLYGPKTKSLTKFYFLILGAAVAFFAIGYWRNPGVLLIPILVLFGMLALAQTLKLRTQLPSGVFEWQEEIALHESRMFDLLAMISWFHLALLAVAPRVTRATWLTAAPQAALILFLYHARSSLAWEYLALMSMIGVRVGGWCWRRLVKANRPTLDEVARPVVVGVLVIASLAALGSYKRSTYNPVYFQELGPRTFWHNALMGFCYHPELRDSLSVTVSDQEIAKLIIRHMQETNDPRLNPSWELNTMMNSLGGHCRFDWRTYEQVAKEIYLSVWREHPNEAMSCYAYYKPLNIYALGKLRIGMLEQVADTHQSRTLLPGFLFAIFGLVAATIFARRSPEFREEYRAAFRVALGILPFSLIPGIAFYAAVTTLACFYIGFVVVLGFALVGVALGVCAVAARLVSLAERFHAPALPVRVGN